MGQQTDEVAWTGAIVGRWKRRDGGVATGTGQEEELNGRRWSRGSPDRTR